MRRKSVASPSQHNEASGSISTPDEQRDRSSSGKPDGSAPKRSAFLWLSLFVVLLNGSWAVYHLQYERLPVPLSSSQAGKRGFSEELAMEHVKSLTKLGPHPLGSDALDLALQYVLATSENIKKTAHWEVDVDVDFFHAKSGGHCLHGGTFRGKTLLYSDLKHVVLRILPKYLPEAADNTILISSHIDTVFSTEGAGDCSSCVAVMLELGRVMSQWAHGFKSGVIFLFNTGEEEGLSGAHSFITQHPWRDTIRFFVDLEALGVGGKSSIFQSGSDPRAIETFAKVAKYPSGQIISQVVHVVDATEGFEENSGPISFISIFSNTPGKLIKELENLRDDGFSCSNDFKLDLVSFTVNYGCRFPDSSHGWNKLEIPTFHVEGEIKADTTKTQVLIDTKVSTRWSLAINSEKVEEFTIEGVADTKDFPLVGNNIRGDGWHVVQFAGGKKSPRRFLLTLFWSNNTVASEDAAEQQSSHLLLKLRTDVDRVTPKTARILEKLPSWCSLFGKSTSPLTLAFLANLRVNF